MKFSQISTEFVIRAKAVSETPDDYYVKEKTLGILKPMINLATSGDAMAQYRLAKAFPKNSAPFLMWMEAAAKQGLTNAMFELSISYAEIGSNSGLRQAAEYFVKIFASEDSYIKSEAKAYIEHNCSLGAEVNRQLNTTSLAKSTLGFFAHESTSSEGQQPDLNSIETTQP